MADLTAKPLIIFKGILFLTISSVSFALLLLESPALYTAVLGVLLVWSSCRFYYFLFYVLEKYVDPTHCYAGIWALMREILARPK